MAEPGAIETVRDLRRAQIIRAARALVADGGLEGLTIGKLEAALSFSRGVITYHFDNKAEIVAAVLESAIAEIDAATGAAMQAAPTVDDKLRVTIAGMVGGFLSHREAGRILLHSWSRLASDPAARTLNAALYGRYRASSAALIRAGQALGAFRTDGVDVDAVAALMVTMVLGIVLQDYFEPGAVDLDAALSEAVAAVRGRLTR